MAGVGPADLHALALELLAADIAALDTIPISAPGLEGSPERAFVSPGRPAIDCCPQLTVHVESVNDAATSPGGLGAGRRQAGKKNQVRLITTIVRCVIDNRGGQGITEMPLMADLEATAEQVNADAWALWNYLYCLWRSGDLLSLCSEMLFEGMRQMGEEGRCAGWTLTISASLDGYCDAEAS